MRGMRVLIGATLFLAATAPAAPAQGPARRWDLSAEGGPLYARAEGTLATYVAGAWGFGARIHAAPSGSRVGFRAEGEYLTFGAQTRIRPYNGSGPPITLTTGSRIFMATAGPEMRVGWRRVGASLDAGVGLAYFSNTGAVDGLGDPERFRRANSFGQVTWGVRGGGGASLRLGRSARSARLHFGAHFVQSGSTPWLREYNLPFGVISGLYLYPTPMRPSFMMLSLGVSAGV